MNIITVMEARALRDMLNIGMCAAEELDADVPTNGNSGNKSTGRPTSDSVRHNTGGKQNPQPATEAQKRAIKRLMTDLNFEYKEDPSLTKAKASQLISSLQEKLRQGA